MSIIISQETQDLLQYYEDLEKTIYNLRREAVELDNKLAEVADINLIDDSFVMAHNDIRHSLRKAVAELDKVFKAAGEYAQFQRDSQEATDK